MGRGRQRIQIGGHIALDVQKDVDFDSHVIQGNMAKKPVSVEVVTRRWSIELLMRSENDTRFELDLRYG